MKKYNSTAWRQALAYEDSKLGDIIKNINDSGLQIALIVSVDEVLIGTVTDGDIRRGLLSGLDMNSPIDSIINRDSMVVPSKIGLDSVRNIMQTNGINALPILNKSRKVVGLHLLNKLLTPKKRLNPMIIMAGGKGTRLMPHTKNCPKPMLLVGAKPILEHIIERAKAEGFYHFVLSIHYLGHVIEDYFDDGSKWGVKIEYLREKSPLGTAGAIGLMSPRPEVPFVVTNGDVITDIRYGELLDFHIQHQAAATMAVRVYEWQHQFGVVHTKGIHIVGFDEKPISRSHINAGVYVLESNALNVLDNNAYCDMPTLFARLKDKKQRTVAYPMHEPWLDVGKPDDLMEAKIQASKTSS